MKELQKQHEAVNYKLKAFVCLKHQWRHTLSKLHVDFCPCLVIVQLTLDNGREVHDVEGYSDPVFPQCDFEQNWHVSAACCCWLR